MNVSYKTIGANIKSARKAAKLTQAQTAERLHMSLLHYGRIERGQRNASLKQLVSIADALNVRIEALLHECIIHDDHSSAVFSSLDAHSAEYVEHALVLVDQFRDQLEAYRQSLIEKERAAAQDLIRQP